MLVNFFFFTRVSFFLFFFILTNWLDQYFQHYYRVIDPNIIRGKWSLEEEIEIAEATCEYSSATVHWANLAKKLTGRTDIQVRYKFKAMLKSLKV